MASLPVLVVGAGPSGLMVAHELKRFGIPCTIIEKDVAKSPYSRAIAVQIRTLEIFHALNMLHHLAEKGHDVDGISLYAESKKPIAVKIETTSSFFEHLMIVDQPHTEKVLEEALAHRGQEIERGVELVDFATDSLGIRANLRMPHGEIKPERFSYIVGADGAHSLVRKKMANQFSGTTYDDAFILADAECAHAHDHHTLRLFFRKHRFLALIPMQGKNHYRLISVRRGETNKMGTMPTIEEFQDLANDVVPFPLTIKNPVWVSRFFVQCRSAARYQEGRIFLVGDAAHIHSPAGGQGMNTGLQDAFNLSWKLALTIKGLAKPELLTTYHDERKPVGDYLIDRTDRLFKFMVRSSLWARLMRRFIVPYVSKTDKIRTRLFTIGSQIAIRYEQGVICMKKHASMEGVCIGKRVPNLRLMTSHLKKTDLHTVSCEGFFSLWLFFPKDINKKQVNYVLHQVNALLAPCAKAVQSHVVFAHDFDADKLQRDAEYFVRVHAGKTFAVTEPAFVLVRPDHHVFCTGLLKELPHAVEGLKTYL